MSGRVVFFWDGSAWRMGVECMRGAPSRGRNKGREHVDVVYLNEGSGVVVRRLWVDDYAARDSMRNGKPYPVRRARAHYRRMGQTWGITKGAETALKEAI